MFRTKTDILNYIHREFDDDEVCILAELSNDHPLSPFSIDLEASRNSILRSLLQLPKAILEDLIATFTIDDDSEEDDSEEDEVEDYEEIDEEDE